VAADATGRTGAFVHQGIAGDFEDFYPEPLNLWLSIQMRPSDEGIVLFFRDISARMESNLALKQQQELLSVVQQSALVATWDVDLATGTRRQKMLSSRPA